MDENVNIFKLAFEGLFMDYKVEAKNFNSYYLNITYIRVSDMLSFFFSLLL